MNQFTESANLIASKLKSQADVMTFSPVFGCTDLLLNEICTAAGGRILCVLPHTPNAVCRNDFKDKNIYFIGNNLTDQEIQFSLSQSRRQERCIVFVSLSVIHFDFMQSYINTTVFSAMLIPYAERISPLVAHFDKRLFEIKELRAQLKNPLPICAFCASDSSAILRDISTSFGLKTPARVYPGMICPDIKLFTDNNIPSFASLENYLRRNNLQKAAVLCTTRQMAEDAYRYFRFYGYKCAVAHGGLHFEPRNRALERFVRGDADILFTTSFAQAPFCKHEYLLAFLGIPDDIFVLQDLSCNKHDIAVFYTKEDALLQAYRIEEDMQVRSNYTSLPPARLKQERQYLHQQLLHALHTQKSPYEALKELLPHIYHDTEDATNKEEH
ncbi:MAG: DEAD/DEAH box helicase [Clostridia bacterium]|nr:DEAD/DEAH box helicase [Clostridia bacterium]